VDKCFRQAFSSRGCGAVGAAAPSAGAGASASALSAFDLPMLVPIRDVCELEVDDVGLRQPFLHHTGIDSLGRSDETNNLRK
jgi:hypothetical protein